VTIYLLTTLWVIMNSSESRPLVHLFSFVLHPRVLPLEIVQYLSHLWWNALDGVGILASFVDPS
jgi:hypothetical protein